MMNEFERDYVQYCAEQKPTGNLSYTKWLEAKLSGALKDITVLSFNKYEMELHPAGTRDKLAWYDDALKAAYQQADGLRERGAAVEAERDAARAELVDRVGPTITLISELLTLLRAGAGENSPEYARALELIGVPPQGDVSDPVGNDPEVLRILHSVNQQESE